MSRRSAALAGGDTNGDLSVAQPTQVQFIRMNRDGVIELMSPSLTESEWLAGRAERAAILAQLDRRIVARRRQPRERVRR